ncbi:MAG: prepilin-type N-terminal cleavage/methylation domain-containing protein [Thermodesulfobacteriota bacterium]
MRKREIYNEKGFTLLELLVALTVLSIVISVVVEVFWLAQRSMEKGRDLMDIELRERIAFDLISKQLSSAFPFPLKEGASSFTGNARSIDFITTLPMGLERRAGLFYVNYVLEESLDGELKTLKVYQRPFHTREPVDREDERNGFTVLAAIEGAAWGYYEDGQWSDEYEGINGKLPERVRLTLTYGRGGRKEKFETREIVIPVIAEARRMAFLDLIREEA